MKRTTRREDGKYHIKGKIYQELFGSRQKVYNKTAYKTNGGLIKRDLFMNKNGRIVSASKHKTAKKEKRLEKAGYFTEKGKFGYVRKTRKSRGGGPRKRDLEAANILIDLSNDNLANDAKSLIDMSKEANVEQKINDSRERYLRKLDTIMDDTELKRALNKLENSTKNTDDEKMSKLLKESLEEQKRNMDERMRNIDPKDREYYEKFLTDKGTKKLFSKVRNDIYKDLDNKNKIINYK
jgi:hypothetical protein